MKRWVVILLFTFSLLSAQQEDKTTKGGFAIQVGNGVLYGGMGGMIEYQLRFKDNVRITPYVGSGFSVGCSDSSSAEYVWYSYAIGVNLEMGRMHRFILGPQIVGARNISNDPENAVIYKKSLDGLSFIAGYKGTAHFGLMWQVVFGVACLQDPLLQDDKYFFQPHVGLGMGYKF
ncbi:MAG TPA: hypothetical protein PK252_02310 [Bacteroidales bacterium]|nr:hypothetical protein [Bacteroidales bacterium]